MKNKDYSLLEIVDIKKSFIGNSVLKGINLKLNQGECLALIGGNGAGKSTLVKIIMSIYKPDSGQIFVNNRKITFSNPSESLNNSIYLVPQEPMLFPNMSLKENVLIGINKNKNDLVQKLENLIKSLGWKLDLDREAKTLTIAEQQLVEILRGLLREANILILDEPTSALTFDEVNSLFKIIKDLKAKGIGLIYITHRLNEVFEIATDVAIMRDGVITINGKVENFSHEMLVEGLLPENKECDNSCEEHIESMEVNYDQPPVFKLDKFSGYGFEDINLEIYPGEILGIAGVVGAGRTELATTIFGLDKVRKGKVYLEGKDITSLPTAKVIQAGINYIPEDRFQNGIFGITNVRNNLTSAYIKKHPSIFTHISDEENITEKYVKDFRVKVTSQEQLMSSLSGGNQQKVIIGRGLSTNPKLLILDEPTRGIDAGARGDVYKIINYLKKTGVAIMLISSDMEEIVELSDRAMTIFQGRVNRVFSKEEVNGDSLMKASFGVDSADES